MADFAVEALLPLTVLFSALLVTLAYSRIRRMNDREQVLIATALLVALVLFLAETNFFVALELEIALLTFNGLLSGKTPEMRSVFVALCLIYIALIHSVGFVLIGQAMLIGILSGITNIREYKNRLVNERVEIERDFFHVGAGVILMLLFFFTSNPVAITALILMIIGGIFAISFTEMFKEKKVSGILLKLERNGASLGYGAMWLALGALVAVSFLGTRDILVVFSAIFIGDPMATIVGLTVGGPKLPWNSRKSVSGTLTYFAVTAALAFFAVGPLAAILIGAIAAFVESLRIKIDDNITVSIALTALLLAFRI